MAFSALLSLGGLVAFVVAFLALWRPALVLPARLKPNRLKGFGCYFGLSMVLALAGGEALPPEVKEQQRQEREARERQREVDAAAAAERKAEADRVKVEEKAEKERLKAENDMQEEYKDITKSVIGVVKIGGDVTVKMKLFGWSNEHDFSSISFDMKEVAKWQAKRDENITMLSFALMDDLKDEFGNVSEGQVARLSLPVEDLRRINWKNFTNWDLLNLLRPVKVSYTGKKMIAAYCLDGKNMQYVGRFCQNALQ